eukprot:132687_1
MQQNKIINRIFYGNYGNIPNSIKNLSIHARSNCTNLSTVMNLKRAHCKYSGRPSFLKKQGQSGHSFQIEQGVHDGMTGIRCKRIQAGNYVKKLVENKAQQISDKISKKNEFIELKCSICYANLGA